jgi:phage terminase large subunit
VTQKIQLPNDWAPRYHQKPIWNALTPIDQGGLGLKRACMVWHRRAGKDSTCINFIAKAMFDRVGTYWHMLPTTTQARKVVWTGIDFHGRRIIDQAIPQEIRTRTNNNDMVIETLNGSVYQCVGSDNYDSLVGSNPIGVVFSEYSLADPAAWNFIRPILAENGGFALFIYTPRGKNHGYRIFEMAKKNPRWYASLSTVEDTFREDGVTPIIDQATIQEERDSGMAEDMIQQEYYGSFDAGVAGSYYTEELNRAEEDGRIGDFPWDPHSPCVTVWDIGIRDATSIGIYQMDQTGAPVCIDYVEGRNKGMDYYIKELREKPYVYNAHYGPHDIETKDWVTGKSRQAMAADDHDFHFDVTPKLSIDDGVEACRKFLNRCKFNKRKVAPLLDALYSYHRTYDDKREIYMDKPVHDWSSHASDMKRYASIVIHPYLFTQQSSADKKVKGAL